MKKNPKQASFLRHFGAGTTLDDRENPRRVAGSAEENSSRELDRRQGLYRTGDRAGAELSRVEIPRVGNGEF